MKPIDKQIEELSEKEKKTIIKVNRYGKLAIILTTLISFIVMIAITILFLKMPNAYLHFNKLVIAIVVITIINLIICVGEYALLKAKFPYYTDKSK